MNDLTRADVTPKQLWLNRRQIMAGAAGLGAASFVPPALAGAEDLDPNSLEEITTYNNFYEFGYEKTDPAIHADEMVIEPWSVKVDGLVDSPGECALVDLLGGLEIEERLYRLRCLEGWSMVIPWSGVELPMSSTG